MDPRGSIRVKVLLLMQVADSIRQFLAPLGTGAGRTVPPGVVAAGRDLQKSAQDPDGPELSMRLDKLASQ